MSALTGLLNAQKQQAQGLRKHEQLKLKEQQLALQKQQEEEDRRHAFEQERRQQAEILKRLARTGEKNESVASGGVPLSKWMTHEGPTIYPSSALLTASTPLAPGKDSLSYIGQANKISDIDLVTKSCYSHTISQALVNSQRGPAAVNRDETANRHPQRRAYSHKKTNSIINIIISCVKNNNVDKLERKVKELIENGEGINGKENDNPFGWSALHYAAFLGNVTITKYLMSVQNIDVNATDGSGVTPLMCAVMENRKDVVAELLSNKNVLIDDASLMRAPERQVAASEVSISSSPLSPLGIVKGGGSRTTTPNRPNRQVQVEKKQIYPHLGLGPGPNAISIAEFNGYHDIVELIKITIVKRREDYEAELRRREEKRLDAERQAAQLLREIRERRETLELWLQDNLPKVENHKRLRFVEAFCDLSIPSVDAIDLVGKKIEKDWDVDDKWMLSLGLDDQESNQLLIATMLKKGFIGSRFFAARKAAISEKARLVQEEVDRKLEEEDRRRKEAKTPPRP